MIESPIKIPLNLNKVIYNHLLQTVKKIGRSIWFMTYKITDNE